VVDEADLFAPQKPQAGDEVLLGHMENIVRRGRVRGFIPWLISQRPAVLNKNVLSQVDGLLAFKLTSVQDRDALDAWIEGQADKVQGKAIKDALPTFKVGEGVIWLPGYGILDRKPFPQKVTFDSSRKPKRGEKLQSRRLKPIDVDRLKEQLAEFVEQQKANDVPTLKKRIVELEAAAKKAAAIDPKAIEDAEKRGFEKGAGEHQRQVVGVFAKLLSAWKGYEAARTTLGAAMEDFEIAAAAIPLWSPATTRALSPAIARAPLPTQGPRLAATASANGDAGIGSSEQRILNAIRWWNVLGIAAPSHAQTAFIAGFSHKSGTWATYLSRLRSKGLIEGRGDLVLTEAGAVIAVEPAAAPTTEALHAAVLDKIDPPLRKILTPLLEAYPSGLTHEQTAGVAGYSHQSGTWATYLSRLRSLDLISGRGELKAEPWLFAA
jgi:uncharacterized protein